MEENLHVREGVVIPGEELGLAFSRSGGPGGQNVNKVASRVTLRWNVRTTVALNDRQRRLVLDRLASRLTVEGELVIHADEHRSQHLNRDGARARLAALVREALYVAPPRIPTRPSRAAKRRRLEAKQQRAKVKQTRRPPAADD